MENSHERAIDMPVAGLEGGEDGALLGVLVLPGTEADGGDGGAGIELEGGHVACGDESAERGGVQVLSELRESCRCA